MQWFFGLADGAPSFQGYSDMIKVAVVTAKRHTALEPHFLYDGSENQLTRWLRGQGVRIVPCRSSFRTEIEKLKFYGEEIHNQFLRRAASGIFLRVELPRLWEEMHLEDRVLYTDCDVFFRGDIVDVLASIQCDCFAVAGEEDPMDYFRMNTGVMLMNLPGLRKTDIEFKKYVRDNFADLQRIAWDQGAYRAFYSQGECYLWSELPPELNWKPYWTNSDDAKLIHFHGPKPFQLSDKLHLSQLEHLTGGAFYALCGEWMELMKEID